MPFCGNLGTPSSGWFVLNILLRQPGRSWIGLSLDVSHGLRILAHTYVTEVAERSSRTLRRSALYDATLQRRQCSTVTTHLTPADPSPYRLQWLNMRAYKPASCEILLLVLIYQPTKYAYDDAERLSMEYVEIICEDTRTSTVSQTAAAPFSSQL